MKQSLTSPSSPALKHIAIATVLIVATAFALVLSACTQAEEPPNVVGQSAQTAWEKLRSDGYYPDMQYVYDDGTEDTVIRTGDVEQIDSSYGPSPMTDPAGNERTNPGNWKGLVKVYVAKNPRVPVAPSVYTKQEISDYYTRNGYTNLNFVEDGDIDPDHCIVVKTEPSEHEKLSYSDALSVTITSNVQVPDITGTLPPNASAIILTAGLVPDVTYSSFSSNGIDPKIADNQQQYGPKVVSCTPAIGTTVRVGTTIAIHYSGSLEGYS